MPYLNLAVAEINTTTTTIYNYLGICISVIFQPKVTPNKEIRNKKSNCIMLFWHIVDFSKICETFRINRMKLFIIGPDYLKIVVSQWTFALPPIGLYLCGVIIVNFVIFTTPHRVVFTFNAEKQFLDINKNENILSDLLLLEKFLLLDRIKAIQQ